MAFLKLLLFLFFYYYFFFIIITVTKVEFYVVNVFFQESALMRGVDVVCATPGRLNDHLVKRGTFVCWTAKLGDGVGGVM